MTAPSAQLQPNLARSSRCFGNLSVGNEKVIEMAESKGALIAKSMQKHAGRAKEKVCNVFDK